MSEPCLKSNRRRKAEARENGCAAICAGQGSEVQFGGPWGSNREVVASRGHGVCTCRFADYQFRI